MNRIHKRQKYEKQNTINMISLCEVEINRYSNMTSFKRFLLLLLPPGHESDSVVTECVWLGRINNQTGCPSKIGKSPKRWMVYTKKNKSCTIYTSYGCPVVYLCCDESQGMEFNLTLKSSREPTSTTEDGTWFHSLMDLGKKECWSVSFLALICLSLYGFLLFWSPLLCNSWLVQWQSVDGGSCSTLQGIVSIVFAGGIPIEDFRA